MGILLNQTSRVLAVAATGPYGRAQVRTMREARTPLVGIVAPGRAGDEMDGLPVFDSVAQSVEMVQANAAVIYSPPLGVRSAVSECADAGLALTVAIAEYVPVHDSLRASAYARERGMCLIGPNTVGLARPGFGMLGSIAAAFITPGRVGIVGRSGTLLLTVARMLTQAGIGQSSLVHVGGDIISGSDPAEILSLFLRDSDTDLVVYLGEIGGTKEYRLAEVLATAHKPVVALIVGRHAPAQKRMGHAGAMVESSRESAQAKQQALAEAGAVVCDSPMQAVIAVKDILATQTSRA